MSFECSNCFKKYTSESWYKKHIEKCKSQPSQSEIPDIEDLHISPVNENLTVDIILKQNIFNKNLLKKVISKEIISKQFKEQCNERYSFWQWGNKSYNIKIGSELCKHDCSYCYMKSINNRFRKGKETKKIEMNEIFELDKKAVNKKWTYKKESNVYFFPSSHDIVKV